MRNFILAVAVVLAGVTGFVGAADVPAKGTGKVLTEPDLFDMLENLGYEVLTKPKETDAVKRITVKVTRADFPIDIPMTINLSGDKGTLYFFVNLADLTAEDLAKADRLQKLLELNDVSGKNQFRLNPKSKQLWAARFTENVNMTPAVLKKHVESLATTVAETREHWDTKKWVATDAAKK